MLGNVTIELLSAESLFTRLKYSMTVYLSCVHITGFFQYCIMIAVFRMTRKIWFNS